MSIGATGFAYVGYPVADLERSRHFYGEVLGLKCIHDEPLGTGGDQRWIEYEVGNETLAISNAWPPSGQSGPSVAIEVENLEAAMEHLRQSGVPIMLETLESPVCHMAVVLDPDGNAVTIHQLKSQSHNA